jgi:hypothetical protein
MLIQPFRTTSVTLAYLSFSWLMLQWKKIWGSGYIYVRNTVYHKGHLSCITNIKTKWNAESKIKHRTTELMREYNTPQRFWCYASKYAVELTNHMAARCIKWRTPYEVLHGDTPDISVFKFSFFEPIFYLNPHATFPQLSMLPGCFLGIARTTGDSFTFIIIQN